MASAITVKPDKQASKERLIERLEEQSRKTGITKNDLAQRAFREYLNRVENPKPDPIGKIADTFETVVKALNITNKRLDIINQRLDRLEK